MFVGRVLYVRISHSNEYGLPMTPTYIYIAPKMNEWDFRPHLCTGLAGPGDTSEDGEMNEMTLPSNRNSSPGGLGPSTLPLDHRGCPSTESLLMNGEEKKSF